MPTRNIKPCSSRGRQRWRWTRAEVYERACHMRIPIWDARRRKLRTMDELCGLIHLTVQPPTESLWAAHQIRALQLRHAQTLAEKRRLFQAISDLQAFLEP